MLKSAVVAVSGVLEMTPIKIAAFWELEYALRKKAYNHETTNYLMVCIHTWYNNCLT